MSTVSGSAQVGAEVYVVSAEVTLPAPMGVNALPTNMAAAPGQTSATLSWTAASTAHADSAYHFQVNDATGLVTIADERIPGTSYVVTGLVPGTTYQWRIATGQDAENYNSPWSDWMTFATLPQSAQQSAGYNTDDGSHPASYAGYSMVMANSWDAATIAAVKSAGKIPVIYQDVSSTRTDDGGATVPGTSVISGGAINTAATDCPNIATGVGMVEAWKSHPEWFLTQAGTATASTPLSQLLPESGFPKQYLMDWGNAAYAAQWANNVVARCERVGVRWVFGDNLLSYHLAYLSAPLGKYPTDAAFQAASMTFMQTVAPILHAAGIKIIYNVGYTSMFDHSASDSLWLRWLPYADGLCNEYPQYYGYATDIADQKAATLAQGKVSWFGTTAGLSPEFTVIGTPTPPAGKVTRVGAGLVCDGLPFRIMGFNMWPMAISSWCQPPNYDTRNVTQLAGVLSRIRAAAPHLNAVKVWWSQQFTIHSGARDWSGFDQVLQTAASYGFKVICPLEDNWSYERTGAHDPALDQAWFTSGYKTAVLTKELIPYRQWVAEVVARYAGDPRILMWELCNEGNAMTTAFADDVSALIKSIDPLTPVCPGGVGDSASVMALPGIDCGSYHYYSAYGQTNYAGDQQVCAAAGKPFYIGEYGIATTDANRASTIASFLSGLFGYANCAGFLYWQYAEVGGDQFDITGPADASVPIMDSHAVQPLGPAGKWKLQFSDEFNGTALDTNKWYVDDGGKQRNATPCYAANVSVAGGCLRLALASASSGSNVVTAGFTGDPSPPSPYRLPVGGCVEARVYFPGDGQGHLYGWPAFWTFGGNGEYDVAEVNGWAGGSGGIMTTNYHYGSTAVSGPRPAGNWADGWHTFTLVRNAASFDMYWDGVRVWTRSTADDNQPQAIRLVHGHGGIEHYPATVLVDYVRAWVPA